MNVHFQVKVSFTLVSAISLYVSEKTNLLSFPFHSVLACARLMLYLPCVAVRTSLACFLLSSAIHLHVINFQNAIQCGFK